MKFSELLQLEGKRTEKNKGEYIFRQGDADQSLYFIESGLLKACYTSAEGKETIKSFLLPGDVIGSMASVFSEEACSFSLLCLQHTVMQVIPAKVLLKYSQDDLELANAVIELLVHVAMKKEKREYEFLCLDAEERFRRLEKSTPVLLKSVTQNDLARYLGVTPVGLSRIKKRVRNQSA